MVALDLHELFLELGEVALALALVERCREGVARGGGFVGLGVARVGRRKFVAVWSWFTFEALGIPRARPS